MEKLLINMRDIDGLRQRSCHDLQKNMKSQLPVYVTRPHLPPMEDFLPYLEEIWKRRVLTNAGPFHEEFERRLSDYLEVDHISLFSNGTLGLVTALQELRVSGEVITTPYSFVATAHALLWNGLKPVFVDIDPVTLNVDPEKIEAAITPQTTAILAVHVYGRPCDTEAIQRIADAYNLRVIYDAAHAFGVKPVGGNLFRCGDLSVLSFHATKVFNTFEGGAVISPDEKTKQRIDRLKNFGFVDEVTVVAPGINGKMNEFSAALGLLQLRDIEEVLAQRGIVEERYRIGLKSVQGIELLPPVAVARANHAYCPILVNRDFHLSRDELYERLKQAGIYARRYFYPLITEFPMYRGLPSARRESLPIASDIAQRVICLPLFPDLTEDEQDKVIRVIATS